MATATQELLESLHSDLAGTFKKMLTEGVPIVDKETGEVFIAQVPPATLNVIRQFLKDNDITGAIEGVKQSLIESDPELALPFENVSPIKKSVRA